MRGNEAELPMYPNSPVILFVSLISLVPTVALAVLAPDDALSRFGFLRQYVSIWSTIIPGIDRLARVSVFPDVTRLVVATGWTLVAIQAALYFAMGKTPARFWIRYRQSRLYYTFAMFIVILVIALIAVLFDIEPKDLEGGLVNERILRGMSSSRMALGFVMGFFLSGVALLIYLATSILTEGTKRERHVYRLRFGQSRIAQCKARIFR